MEYPEPVQERLDILNDYELVEKLDNFNIIHLYSGDLAYPNGYYNCRFFRAIAYNTKTMKKWEIGNQHDSIVFWKDAKPSQACVFADGAFLIEFEHPVSINFVTQTLYIGSFDIETK